MKLQRRHKTSLNTQDRDAIGRISALSLRLMIGLTVLVFAAFFLIGYNGGDDLLTQRNVPRLTGVLITTTICFVIGTIALVIWSIIKTVKKSKTAWNGYENGVARRKILMITIGTLIVIMLLSFTFGSTDKMLINHQPFSDKLTLRLANMFVTTSIILLIGAIIAIIADWARKKIKKNV